MKIDDLAAADRDASNTYRYCAVRHKLAHVFDTNWPNPRREPRHLRLVAWNEDNLVTPWRAVRATICGKCSAYRGPERLPTMNL